MDQQVKASGGNRVMTGLGTGLRWKGFTVDVAFQRPVFETLNGNQLHMAGRLINSITYCF